jgi:pimeloyl-ACP methyl ester carboxylesterase
VHGGAHGAWCWTRLIPELEKRGHEAIAVDLPGHGERRDEVATLDGYRQAVVDVLQPQDVLVGHSVGCAVATMAADQFLHLAHIIYINGPIPVEGEPLSYQLGGSTQSGEDAALFTKTTGGAERYMIVTEDGNHFTFTLDGARECFYHDCSPELARWAFERLTPQRADILVNVAVSVPRFWEADLPRSYVICTEDRAVPIELSLMQVERLGVEPLYIDSSHSPFLSRPGELAALMIRALSTTPIAPMKVQS